MATREVTLDLSQFLDSGPSASVDVPRKEQQAIIERFLQCCYEGIGKAPKFYLVDVGVAGHLTARRITEPRGEEFGRALEHFLLMEILAHRSYTEKDYPVGFWRTKTGFEVDFVLADGEVAIEVKGSDRIDTRDLRALRAFSEEYKPRTTMLICNEPARRLTDDGVLILPWREFLSMLWEGDVVG